MLRVFYLDTVLGFLRLGVAIEQLADEVLGFFGNFPVKGDGGGEDLAADLGVVVAIEGRVAKNHLVHQHPERPVVRAAIVTRALQDLRRLLQKGNEREIIIALQKGTEYCTPSQSCHKSKQERSGLRSKATHFSVGFPKADIFKQQQQHDNSDEKSTTYQVVRRPAQRVCVFILFELFGEPEVDDLYVSFAVEQHVLQLKVAVDNAPLVNVVEPEEDGRRVKARAALGEGSGVGKMREELPAEQRLEEHVNAIFIPATKRRKYSLIVVSSDRV